MANTYSTSSGKRYTSKQIDDKIRIAKAEALRIQFEEHGYNYCLQCGSNGNGTRLDCSHEFSAGKAKKEGRAEVAWDVKNIIIRCRKCHEDHDNNFLSFNR